jgi:acyl-CoA synthetase (AMP-forming)/AMP-acid ligase II
LSVTRSSNWQAHLPPGVDPAELDLLAAGPGWRSRGDLDAASARVAGRLRRAGLAAGDRVLVSAATSMELVVAYLGALRMGLVVVPVNTAYREREVAHIVGDAHPRAAVVDDPERGEWARKAAGGDLLVAGPEVDLPDGDPPPLDRGGPADPALLCYTSGTAGAPKGPSWPTATCWPASRRSCWPGAGPPRTGSCWPCPCSTSTASGSACTAPWWPGPRPSWSPRFDVDAVLDAARDHQATLFFGVPTMYARLADSPRAGCGCASPDRRRCPPWCSSAWPSGPGSGCWSATA